MGYFILTLLLLLCDPRLIDQPIAICTAHTDGLHSSYIQTPCHLKFLGTRVAYYSNATSTLQLDILTSGDVNLNPGPEVCVNKTITEPDYPKITYTPDKLKALNNSSYSLCTNVVDCLKQLGIKRRHTHRGIRGGRRKTLKTTATSYNGYTPYLPHGLTKYEFEMDVLQRPILSPDC